MASIENREVLKRIEKECFTSPGREPTPKQLSNTVVPVIDASPEPRGRVLKHYTRTTTASNVNSYTTDEGNDTYLTAIQFSNASDAAATNTEMYLSYTDENGEAQYLIYCRKISTTAGVVNFSTTFGVPIKVKRGTNILFSNAFGAGVSYSAYTLFGYTVSPQ